MGGARAPDSWDGIEKVAPHYHPAPQNPTSAPGARTGRSEITPPLRPCSDTRPRICGQRLTCSVWLDVAQAGKPEAHPRLKGGPLGSPSETKGILRCGDTSKTADYKWDTQLYLKSPSHVLKRVALGCHLRARNGFRPRRWPETPDTATVPRFQTQDVYWAVSGAWKTARPLVIERGGRRISRRAI